MTTDRALLEAAARAAGIEHRGWWETMGALALADPVGGAWNPLTDDRDEARLEAALCLHVEWRPLTKTVWVGTDAIGAQQPWGDDRQAARRRAGVRAAAAMDPLTSAPTQE